MEEESSNGIMGIIKKQQPIKSLFGGRNKPQDSPTERQWIPQLSTIANSVVERCARILFLPPELLQHQFEDQMPEEAKKTSCYARNLLEYCCYSALQVLIQQPDHVGNKDFRCLTYDMMLAWETPGTWSETSIKESKENEAETEDEDGGSLFYLDSLDMAVQVDEKKTIGLEAFSRIAPASPVVADILTVHNLFDALTCSSGGRLHFLIYEKYLIALDKVIRTAKSFGGPPLVPNSQLKEGEFVVEVDGTVPTQPVLQHVGISAWPGRLTLTNRAFYFEPMGVGTHDKAIAYDLSSDLKQIVKREMTGPLGAKLFDKAVSYNSMSLTVPISMEFPEFKGHLRRDYWLAIIREILHVNHFIRKFCLEDIREGEVLSKAILAIFRCRALRDAFHNVPSHVMSILPFTLAEKLPRGDNILEALSSRLALLNIESCGSSIHYSKMDVVLHPVSLLTLHKFGFRIMKEAEAIKGVGFFNGDVYVGYINPICMALNQSRQDSGKSEAARATVAQVKLEGIEANLAVMKELLSPLVELAMQYQSLASWDNPIKSLIFLILVCYANFRYILPSSLLLFAFMMLWHKHHRIRKPVEVFKVMQPAPRNAVEQLFTFQEISSQLETVIQAANVVFLKLRSLLLATLPQATNAAALFLIFMAFVFAFVPLNCLIMLMFLEGYTRKMPLRKDSSEKINRRLKEWWVRIPAAPVQIIKPVEIKTLR